jgi:diguanylate cyclase (GGDEF)-like protein
VLTGLYNRSYFEEELVRLQKGRQFPISIVALRVDDLRDVNERDGVAAGNELLKQTAGIMKVFRIEDLVARVGGDRFAALMPSSGRSIAENVLLRLRRSVEAHNKHSKGAPLNLSVGLATGEKGCSLGELLTQAESTTQTCPR